jgi:hypothetical protein
MDTKWAQMGSGMSLFGVFLFSEKRFSGFWGMHWSVLGAVAAIGCPVLGHSYFRKKGFQGFGGCLGAFWGGSGDRMSLFGVFLFSEKRFSWFWGML